MVNRCSKVVGVDDTVSISIEAWSLKIGKQTPGDRYGIIILYSSLDVTNVYARISTNARKEGCVDQPVLTGSHVCYMYALCTQIEDLEGRALYDVLHVEPRATTADIRKAYRQLARVHHPDKGGDGRVFSEIRHAYEVLTDSTRRSVYDRWAKELEFRYVRHNTSAATTAQGGEDVLLDEFVGLGLSCDPATQLVVTCEVCRRPATKECWTCKMQICEFCTLKRHWKDGYPLHWPLINSDHMREKLAMKELEHKKKEDARLTDQANPNFRSEAELKDIRAFKEAAFDILEQHPETAKRSRVYDLRLAKFYMWAQTQSHVIIACKIPTGYSDTELVIEINGHVLVIQAENSPPLIERAFAEPIDTTQPVETFKTADNTTCILLIQKHEWNHHWPKLFEGDSDGSRCLVPPYDMYEGEDDVILQIEIPFWIEPEDVAVEITEHEIDVMVKNCRHVARQFWRNAEEEGKRDDYRVVNVEDCSWHLEDDIDASGGKCKILCITLIRPELTEDEIKWKKRVRQDNRQGKRRGAIDRKGWRFFIDDEDECNLEDCLQALCLLKGGKTFVPVKPWDHQDSLESRWTTNVYEISPHAREFLLEIQDKP